MKVLAIDTATEQCSAALIADERWWERAAQTARGHAEMILPMVDELLAESGLRLCDLDGVAFGRGPGSFTGVRIGVSVAQGLALSCDLSVVGVSDLAAVARQTARAHSLAVGAEILVCMDARMQEVYWGRYRVERQDGVKLLGEERVSAPDEVPVDAAMLACGAGAGWAAYPALRNRYPALAVDAQRLPHARDVAQLALSMFAAGAGMRARDAAPVYLRDDVAQAPSR